MFKWTIITLSGLAALVVCFGATANIIAMRPVKAIDDSDILYRPRVIEDEKNAFTILQPLSQQIKEKGLLEQLEPFMEGGLVDFDKHSELLDKVSPYLAEFDKAMTRDDMAFPADYLLPRVAGSIQWYGQSLILLEKLKWAHVKKLLKDRKFPEACAEVEKMLKFAYLFQSAGGTLVDGAIAMVTKGIAISTAQEVAASGGLDHAMCRRMIDSLHKYGDNSGLADVFRGDYTFWKNSMKITMEERLKNQPAALSKYQRTGCVGWAYNGNWTFNKLALYTRQEIKNVKGRYAQVHHYRVLSNIIEEKYPTATKILLGNTLGRIMIGAIQRGGNVIINKFQKDTQVNLTITFLALRAYHADRKALPGDLAQLVSAGYIDTIPEDPFDNKPVRYDINKKIIYSVGPDMEDDKGNKEKDVALTLGLL